MSTNVATLITTLSARLPYGTILAAMGAVCGQPKLRDTRARGVQQRFC